jgi:hypothetical protein
MYTFSGISEPPAEPIGSSSASHQPTDRRQYEPRDADGVRTADMRRAIDEMLESVTVTREARAGTVGVDRLAQRFNALLQQVKEQFPDSTGLRLIEPVTADGSVAVIAVRLVLVKRTIDAELARSAKAS